MTVGGGLSKFATKPSAHRRGRRPHRTKSHFVQSQRFFFLLFFFRRAFYGTLR